MSYEEIVIKIFCLFWFSSRNKQKDYLPTCNVIHFFFFGINLIVTIGEKDPRCTPLKIQEDVNWVT